MKKKKKDIKHFDQLAIISPVSSLFTEQQANIFLQISFSGWLNYVTFGVSC